MKTAPLIISYALVILALTGKAFSQGVAINNDNSAPDPSAMLDVKSINKGLLVPRMTQAQRISILAPSTGLLVYQGNNASGFYFFNGTEWIRLSGYSEGWSTTGNVGTNPETNFIGTTDNQPLNFRLNNIPAGQFDPDRKNYFIGLGSGYSNLNGSGNIAIGSATLMNMVNSFYNIAIGDSALHYNNSLPGSNLAIGRAALRSNSSGSTNIGIGPYALYSNTDGDYNIAIGNGALFKNISGISNLAIGNSALYYNVSGDYNTAIGHNTLRNNTSGQYNTAIGYEVMNNNTEGSSNTGLGYRATSSNTTGINNTGIGASALINNSVGYDNTAVGSNALKNNQGQENTAIGSFTLYSNITGVSNIAIGASALYSNTQGTGNVAVGNFSLYSNISGGYNTTLGFGNGSFAPSDIYNTTMLGFGAGDGTIANNHVNIGNTSVTWIGGQVNWATYSDSRIKRDIQENVPGLSFVMKLKPVTYRYDIHEQNKVVYAQNSDSISWPGKYDIEAITQTGFIAQEVETAARQSNYDFSGVISPAHENGLYSIRYAEFVVPLVKAVQEQQLIIQHQQEEIDKLKKLTTEIEELKLMIIKNK
ncbi:MAG: tail fiber domain-containing protein [Bacteroidales bacterium]|nr:tail fiber domain-containing protein [Bacteroidales bacterium]